MTRIAGITAERTATGRATTIHLNVRKHSNNIHLKNFLNEVGFEVEPVKWTAKMKQSSKQIENGEWVSRSLEEVLSV